MVKKRSAQIFLSAAFLILVIIFGTIYVVSQQVQRNDANYPQIQIAEDTAASLDGGVKPSQLVSGHVDMNQSLAPFTVIYSMSGQPLVGSGYLSGRLPAAPIGILQAARGKNYHFVTWQPEGNLRIAAVTTAANNYYVLSGRSLSEVERSENIAFWLSFAGGAACLVVAVIGYALELKFGIPTRRS